MRNYLLRALALLLFLCGPSQAAGLRLFINLDARSPEEALVSGFGSRNAPEEIIYTRDDLRSVELHFLEEEDGDPTRPFRYVDPSSWPTVKFAAGTKDLIPTGGTFTITDSSGAQTTGAIAYNASAATVQTAIRAGLSTNFSSATVTEVTTGVWTIDRVSTGAFAGTLTITATALTPSGSTGYVINTEDGTASLSEKWQIGLARAHPILRTTGWAALASASVGVTTQQAGSGTANKIFRVQYNSDAYAGGVALNFTGDTTTSTVSWAYNATAQDVLEAFEEHTDVDDDGVRVQRNGPGDWSIEMVGTGLKQSNTPALATSSNTLQVPVGLTASLSSNTALVTSLLGSDDTAEVTTEVEIARTSGQPETVVQVLSTLSRDLIRNTPGSSTGLEIWASLDDLENELEDLLTNLPDGSAAAPSVAFENFPDSGIYTNPADGGVYFAVDGANVVAIDAGVLAVDGIISAIDAASQVQIPSGSAGSPSLNFNQSAGGGGGGDSNTGIYRVGEDQFGITTGGTNRVTVSTTTATLAVGQVDPISAKTDNYTATGSDRTLIFTVAAAKTLTLPASASHTGRIFEVKNTAGSSDPVSIDPNGAELIDGAASFSLGAGSGIVLRCDGTGWHILGIYVP